MATLVTGATGFIGRHLIGALNTTGGRVRAVYRNEAKARDLLPGSIERIRGDICDLATMREAAAGTRVIYHCGAAHSSESDEVVGRTNAESVRCLLEAVRANGDRPRIVLMSSINVLGNRSYANATESMPTERTGELHVDQKIEAEQLAERWIKDGADIVILRPGWVYGAGDAHLPKLGRAIWRGKFMFIGSRDNVVPLVHVSDMVDAMKLAGEAPLASGKIYHITDGSRTTIGELVGYLARALDCSEPRRKLPVVIPRVVNAVCGMLGRGGPVSPSALRFLGTSRHVNIDSARRELGFQPRVGAASGVEELSRWLRETVVAELAA